MNYDDDNIRPPIPSYKDKLIQDVDYEKAIEESLIDLELEKALKESINNPIYDNDLEKAINASINDENEFEYVLQQSLLEFNEKENDIESILNSSLETYNIDIEKKILNDSYDEFLSTQEQIKKDRNGKLINFINNLKRVIILQKNDTLSGLLDFLINYSNCTQNEYSINKDEYKKIFNEIKNIRYSNDVLNILNEIIVISSDISL